METDSTTNETTKAPSRIERRAKEALKELETVKSELAELVKHEALRFGSNDDDVECTVMTAHDAFEALARAHDLVECIYDPSRHELESFEEEIAAEGTVQQ